MCDKQLQTYLESSPGGLDIPQVITRTMCYSAYPAAVIVERLTFVVMPRWAEPRLCLGGRSHEAYSSRVVCVCVSVRCRHSASHAKN